MNEETLNRKLRSVGKTVFTECFSIFESYENGQISRREDCIEKLRQKYPKKKKSGCSICIGNAKINF